MIVLIIFMLSSFILPWSSANQLNSRPSVVFLGDGDWNDNALVFRSASSVLYWCVTAHKKAASLDQEKGSWNKINLPEGTDVYSNPVSLRQSGNVTFLLFQSTNGQVFANRILPGPQFGKWVQVGGNLPYDEGSTVRGLDSVSLQNVSGKLYVVARSYTNASHLYWSSLNKENLVSSSWQMIGGSSAKLLTDAAIVYNDFTKLLEAFMVSTNGFLYRSWQTSSVKWSAWDKTGYGAPKTSHAPVVHQMDTNIFNGRLNVFIHGDDGKLHHIWQTTCDKVPNPWGWCTWSTWNTIGNDVPATDSKIANTLSIGNNIHLGIEVFVVDTKGVLYKMWQSKRHGSWSTWQLVEGTTGYQIASLPAIVNDGTGWWSAYCLDSSSDVLIVRQNRSFTISPSILSSSEKPVVVKWNMPVDEASSTDWIGVYPHSASNHMYVDYMYVGGTQNPTSEVLPSGNVTFTTFLPQGKYDVRYLVNKRYVAAIGTTMIISKGSTEPEWVQVFRGIFSGLGIKDLDIETCVKDAEHIPDAFKKAFVAFEDRAIFRGLQQLGMALGDVMKSMEDCNLEKEFVRRIEVFVKDLVSCASASQCSHFLVDVGKEILVLYENIYEIYGDIYAASNSFKIEAFVQGGVNVGRVINACIALPR